MLLEDGLHRETRARGVYSHLHRGLVETRSPLPGRTTTESESREFGHAFVRDFQSADVLATDDVDEVLFEDDAPPTEG